MVGDASSTTIGDGRVERGDLLIWTAGNRNDASRRVDEQMICISRQCVPVVAVVLAIRVGFSQRHG